MPVWDNAASMFFWLTQIYVLFWFHSVLISWRLHLPHARVGTVNKESNLIHNSPCLRPLFSESFQILFHKIDVFSSLGIPSLLLLYAFIGCWHRSHENRSRFAEEYFGLWIMKLKTFKQSIGFFPNIFGCFNFELNPVKPAFVENPFNSSVRCCALLEHKSCLAFYTFFFICFEDLRRSQQIFRLLLYSLSVHINEVCKCLEIGLRVFI